MCISFRSADGEVILDHTHAGGGPCGVADGVMLDPVMDGAGKRHGAVVHFDPNAAGLDFGVPLQGASIRC